MLWARKVSENKLDKGDSIVTTEKYRNIHWFGSPEEDSIILNVNIAGLYKPIEMVDPRQQLDKQRSYIDIYKDQDSSSTSPSLYRFIDKELAFKKYGGCQGLV